MPAALKYIPRSRYLIWAGALLAIPLAVSPWLIIQIEYWYPGYFGATYSTQPDSPIAIFLHSLNATSNATGDAPLARIFLILVCAVPGIACGVWLRQPIQTWSLRIGVGVYSIWVILLTWFDVATLHNLLADARFQRSLWIDHIIAWRPALGMYLAAPTLGLLWLSLIFLWREVFQHRAIPVLRGFQRQAAPNYLSAALVTAGGVCWFIGFYGMYWYLPSDCPATPLFGFAQCNNRLDTLIGFVRALHEGGVYADSFNADVYWVLGLLLVCSGVALGAFLWLRPSIRADILWLAAWGIGVILFTALSFVGTNHLALAYAAYQEQLTAGFPLSVLGVALLAIGVGRRWDDVYHPYSADEDAEAYASDPNNVTESDQQEALEYDAD